MSEGKQISAGKTTPARADRRLEGTDIGKRIQQVRGTRSRDEFAEAMGVHKITLGRYERGERLPDAEFLARICTACGVSPSWLLLGEEPMSRNAMREPRAAYDAGEFVVPPREGHAQPDGQTPLRSPQLVDDLAFRREWLASALQVDAPDLVVVHTSSDAMEPTIRTGDLLAVDTAQRQVGQDAIYVIRQDEALVPRRIQKSHDGSLHLRCDNNAYADQVIAPGSAAELSIVGRVVWYGRKI